jgi:hypothetical protein
MFSQPIVNSDCRATEGHGSGGVGLTAAQAGAMGMATGPVTSTSGATRIIVLVNCVQRDELIKDEFAPPLSPTPWKHSSLQSLQITVCSHLLCNADASSNGLKPAFKFTGERRSFSTACADVAAPGPRKAKWVPHCLETAIDWLTQIACV